MDFQDLRPNIRKSLLYKCIYLTGFSFTITFLSGLIFGWAALLNILLDEKVYYGTYCNRNFMRVFFNF